MSRPSRRLDKLAFFEDLGYVPHDGQLEIHLDDHSRLIVACGVRWGKTICAAMEGLAAAMEPREQSYGWVVAPTYDLANKVFREILRLAREHLNHHVVSASESKGLLVLRNMGGGLSEIRTKSGDSPTSLLGEGLDWLIVDEAARLKPSIWQGHLSQRLIDKRGWALLISTPKGKGYFHELFRRGQGQDSAFRSWNQPSWSNPHLPKDLIEEERERLPDRAFQQEYEAQFLEGEGAVFRYVSEAATGEWEAPVKGARYFAGLDLAKSEDYTVLIVMDESGRVVAADRFRRQDWDIQIERVRALTDKYNDALTFVDSTGAGEPVYEALAKAGCTVRGYTLTARSKADLVTNLSIQLERRELVLPRQGLMPDLIEELEAFEYTTTAEGNIRTGAPSGYHDDCVIALGLAALALRKRPRGQNLALYPAKIFIHDDRSYRSW